MHQNLKPFFRLKLELKIFLLNRAPGDQMGRCLAINAAVPVFHDEVAAEGGGGRGGVIYGGGGRRDDDGGDCVDGDAAVAMTGGAVVLKERTVGRRHCTDKSERHFARCLGFTDWL